MGRAFVALGSNLDDPRRHVLQAMDELSELPGTQITGRSSLYRTAPVGEPDQPDFINAVVRLETALEPLALLDGLLAIERRHGRVRSRRNAPRTLDLDLLLYDDRAIDTPELQLPHPRMHERAFALLPLAELAPDASIPGRGAVAALLAGVAGQHVVREDAR